MGFDDGHQMMPPDGGAPVTSLDVAIGFVTEFNENTAIFAQVANMLMGLQLETLLVGYEVLNSSGYYGNENSEFAAQVFDETGESLAPVDTHALSNRVDGLSNLVNLMKGGISTAQSSADIAQKTANTAMSIAKQAMSKATVNSVTMSDKCASSDSYRHIRSRRERDWKRWYY